MIVMIKVFSLRTDLWFVEKLSISSFTVFFRGRKNKNNKASAMEMLILPFWITLADRMAQEKIPKSSIKHSDFSLFTKEQLT